MPRKRSNSEGSIYYSESRGRWQAALVVGRTDDGKLRRRTFTGPTRKSVAAKLDAAKAALDQGLRIPDPTVTVAAYSQWWAAHVLPGEGLAAATETWYRNVIASYLTGRLNGRTLSGPRALTPSDVEAITTALERDGYSHRVADATRTTLSKILHDAQQRGLVARNVARLSKRPKDRGRARAVKAMTPTEVAELIERLDQPWRTLTVIGATTGLRPGELLALHWPDVHLTATEPYLSVRLSLSHATGSPILKAPKRDRSYRTVPLPPDTAAEFRQWRKSQAAAQLRAGELWSPDWTDLTFTTAEGLPMRVDSFRHALGRAMPGVHPHRLRHTYATHLLERGQPIHHVAELLGDSVATVEASYSHIIRIKHETASVAASILGGGR